MKYIREKGFRMPSRPVGDNRSDLQKRIDKARNVAKMFAAENNLKYAGVFEEDKSKKEVKSKKEEKREIVMKRGREKLEARDKERKENKEHQLKLELNKFKMESLRARNKSRKKYEDFEKDISKLKDKIRQKERLVTELRRDLARVEVDCEEWRKIADKAKSSYRGPKCP